MNQKVLLIGILSLFFAIAANAQKGTVKIFSELKGITVYLDEVNQGYDVSIMDSVDVGSHYLKVVKDDVIVYGELINVNGNAVTTILVKNNQEVKNKIIDSKSDEIQQYKMQRMDVMLSTRYVTNTSSQTNSTYYPGFFSTTIGVSKTNVVSNSIPVTDWFITQGGNKKISQEEFAKITNFKLYYDRVKASQDYCETKNEQIRKARTKHILSGLAFVAITAIIAANVDFSEVASAFLVALPATGAMIFFVFASTDKKLYPVVTLTMEEVRNQAYFYNQLLKIRLGLPENYEP